MKRIALVLAAIAATSSASSGCGASTPPPKPPPAPAPTSTSPPKPATPPPPPPIVLGDDQFYTHGSFAAWAGPWGKGSLSSNSFKDTIVLQPASFPNKTAITWSWPSTPAQSVYGFMALDYGDYDGTFVASPIP